MVAFDTIPGTMEYQLVLSHATFTWHNYRKEERKPYRFTLWLPEESRLVSMDASKRRVLATKLTGESITKDLLGDKPILLKAYGNGEMFEIDRKYATPEEWDMKGIKLAFDMIRERGRILDVSQHSLVDLRDAIREQTYGKVTKGSAKGMRFLKWDYLVVSDRGVVLENDYASMVIRNRILKRPGNTSEAKFYRVYRN